MHWGLFDPAGAEGSDAQKAEAFDRAHQIILKAQLDPIAQIH
ncbi:hypothetical protein [Stenotrophomonas lacuserhaii]